MADSAKWHYSDLNPTEARAWTSPARKVEKHNISLRRRVFCAHRAALYTSRARWWGTAESADRFHCSPSRLDPLHRSPSFPIYPSSPYRVGAGRYQSALHPLPSPPPPLSPPRRHRRSISFPDYRQHVFTNKWFQLIFRSSLTLCLSSWP